MEDLSSTVSVEIRYVACRFPFRETSTQNATRGGAGDQVKEVARRLPGCLFDPFEDASGYDPANTATIEAQDTDDLIWHGSLPPYNSISAGHLTKRLASRIYRPDR